MIDHPKSEIQLLHEMSGAAFRASNPLFGNEVLFSLCLCTGFVASIRP